MSRIIYLEKYGLTPKITPTGKLVLSGLSKLTEPDRSTLIQWARENKEGILNELSTKKTNLTKKASKHAFLDLLHSGKIALLTVGGNGLYPVPRSMWADNNWSQVQSLWLGCFREIFSDFEKGMISTGKHFERWSA